MIEIRVPDEQEGTKAVVRAWLKQIGDAVAENDPLVELETDKVTQEVPAPGAGVLAEIVLDTDSEAIPRVAWTHLNGRSNGGSGEGRRRRSACSTFEAFCAAADRRDRDSSIALRPPGMSAAWHRSNPHQRDWAQWTHHPRRR